MAVLAVAAAVVVGTSLWASDRGLDLTDEGFALLSHADPRADAANFSQFSILVDLLVGPLEPGVAGYRVLRLALLSITAALLGGAFFDFCNARLPRLAVGMPGRATVTVFVMVTGLLGYSWLPNTLSYNDLNTVLVQLEGLLLLRLGAAGDHRLSRWQTAGAVALGGLVAVQVFVKWTAALAVLGLAAAALLGWAGVRRGVWSCALVISGVVLTLVATTVEGLGGPFRMGALLTAAEITASGENHDPSQVLVKYGRTLLDTVLTVLSSSSWRVLALVVLLAGASGLAVAIRPARRAALVSWIAGGVAGTALLVEAVRLSVTGSGYVVRGLQGELLVSVLLASGLSALLLDRTPVSRDDRRTRWTTVGVLLGLPFAAAFGTSSSLVLHAVTAAAGVGCLILLIVAGAIRRSRDHLPSVHLLAPAVLAAVFAAMVVHGTVLAPYRLPTPLLEQATAVEDVPRLEGIHTDPATARFLRTLHRIALEETDYRAGDPILALSHMPGLVYALEGTAPGPVWIDYPAPGVQERTCNALRTAPAAVAATDLVLLNSAVTPEMQACLEDLLPGWPDEFQEVGSVENSYADITELYAETVRVFARD